ncbi:uncharacterized protein LOC130752074 [Actinidia eriantha]|uniref:uncharacterized protein LOC130752074 n=1 Tax=Actinidia eriantha TaxID=165200 RepID=UPI0025871F89|nr:uncharacterized protein LOC130752074 [Actinidia eriantha]
MIITTSKTVTFGPKSEIRASRDTKICYCPHEQIDAMSYDLLLKYSRYRLPQIIFSFKSLTFLSLKNCDIDLEGNSINFKLISLKILSLEGVNFLGGAISDLISSSPILECLSVKNCSMSDNFDLFIKNVCMKTLKIHETHNCFSRYIFAVNAPFITSFELITTMSWKSYVIGEMKSLESARVDCTQCHPYCTLLKAKAKAKDCSIVKILGKFCHVKDLTLSSCYLQALSRSEVKGLGFLVFDVTRLQISTGLVNLELPGIAYMLRHSPNVETLIIAIDN